MTADGYLENAQGARLTGFPAGVGTGGQPEVLQVPAGAMAATATDQVRASFNLDATVDEIDRVATPFDATDGGTYSYANTGTAYDSLGVQHTMTSYFTKTGENQWEVRVALDGNADATNVGELAFNNNGTLDEAASTFPNYAFTPGGGANPISFPIDFEGTTQFGQDFALDSLTQNGYTAGSLVGIALDELGNIVGNYSNEQSQVLGTIALANCRNPEGLEPQGDNAWAETGASGQPLLGLAGSGQFGSLEAGAVETSNVDLTSARVDLIVAQRNYPAHTKTITVQHDVMQPAVNLR